MQDAHNHDHEDQFESQFQEIKAKFYTTHTFANKGPNRRQTAAYLNLLGHRRQMNASGARPA